MHKVSNVLNHFPKAMQPAVTADLRDIHHAETRAAALAATETLQGEIRREVQAWGDLPDQGHRGPAGLSHDFPAEHRDHLRTANPIESVFATVKHRTVRTKGALSQKTARLMVFTLVRAASKTWRRLNGTNQLPRVIDGVTFTDGIAVSDAAIRVA